MSGDFSVDGLSGGYGDTLVLRDFSLEAKKGTAVGVIGRNGAGKSTLCKLLQGSLPQRAGKVSLGKQDLSGASAYDRRLYGLGFMPQTGMVFDTLTVAENLQLARNQSGLADTFAMFPRLQERQKQIAGSMSGGERKILGFARVMLEATKVVILDEPSEGVQPENVLLMQKRILDCKQEGRIVILAEQNLNMLLGCCDKFVGLESGRPIFERTAQETNRERLLAALAL